MGDMPRPHDRWFAVLGTAFLVLWIALGIAPIDRPTWALENLLTVVFAVVLFLTRRKFPFSRLSYALLFVFLLLHSVGAHYTYAKVPYDAYAQRFLGWSPNETFGWERNNYDRVVHFGYGLLLAYPAREIFLRIAAVRGFWGYFFPWLLMVAESSVFELFEWGAAILFGEGLGMTYLGTQGDEWDAQKDVMLATIGAAIAMTATALVNRRLSRDFAREWADSLRVKKRTPLGEGPKSAGI
jgi:putative membrane protein